MEIENLKKYIKENNNIEKLFYNGLKENTLEKKFEYIKEHFKYFTMNSWNGLKSIANNIKVYNLNLDNEIIDKSFEIISNSQYCDNVYENLNFTIEEFERLTNAEIFFNGRSGGYIVLTPKNGHNILDLYFSDNICEFDTFKQFKKESIDSDFSNNDIEYMNGQLLECYYLLKAFDKLCDILRYDFIYQVKDLENANIIE